MKFKNQILNRLFGDGREMTEELRETEGLKDAEGNHAEGLSESSAEEESYELPPLAVGEMEFTAEHALNQLHTLWTGAEENAVVFRLQMEGVDELPHIDFEQESLRLKKEIDAIVGARLKEIEQAELERREKEEKKKEAAETAENTSDIETEKKTGEAEGPGETAGPEETDKSEEAEKSEEAPPIKLDALPLVYVSSDKLAAWLLIFPPVGEGKSADREVLENVLKEKGIAFGVDEVFLEQLPEEEKRYFRLMLAAKGKPAVDGKDGYIEDFFSRSGKREIDMDESGRIDYTSLNIIQSAEKGDVICQAIPPEKGVSGRTVLDQEIQAKDGKAAALPKGRNTEISEDGSKLLASRAGRVEFSGRSFNIKYSMDISGNVDYSTGNINFLGDVHIGGDVRSGFTVRSVGNITVEGVVEASNVEAGGDLKVSKGIMGDTHTIIRSHHNIYAKYLENSIIHVRENLYADSLVNCEVYCDGEVQIRSGRGTIIGGEIRAARGVSAKIIGSKSESPTAVFLGGHPCIDFEYDLILEKIKDMENELEQLERQPESPARTQRMGKLKLDLSVGRMKLGQFEKDLEKEKKRLEDEGTEKSRLKCDLVYPGLSLTIDSETIQVTRETSMCDGRLVDGEIQLM